MFSVKNETNFHSLFAELKLVQRLYTLEKLPVNFVLQLNTLYDWRTLVEIWHGQLQDHGVMAQLAVELVSAMMSQVFQSPLVLVTFEIR